MADTHTSKQRRANMQAVPSKNTAVELLVRSTIHRLGFRFRLHRKDLPGTPDIVFPSRKSVIFVHGCFWHGHECSKGSLPSSNVKFWQAKIQRNRERDSHSEKQLRKDGWRTLTVWECETKDKDTLVKRICQFLECTIDNKQTNKEMFTA